MGTPSEALTCSREGSLREILSTNCPHLVKETDMEIQEGKMNQKRPTPRQITIKMPKVKDIERTSMPSVPRRQPREDTNTQGECHVKILNNLGSR